MKWLLLIIPSLLVSCASVKEEPVAVNPLRKSPSVWLNGAELRSDVQPMNGEGALGKANLLFSANTSTLEGPFFWQFVAEGEPEEHVSMTIEGVVIETQRTRRKVSIPGGLLGGAQPFAYEQQLKPKFSFRKKEQETEKEPAKWLAVYKLPSSLQLFPKVDGKITLAAKIKIESAKGVQSEWVNFALIPNSQKTKSFHFRQTMIEYGGVPIE